MAEQIHSMIEEAERIGQIDRVTFRRG